MSVRLIQNKINEISHESGGIKMGEKIIEEIEKIKKKMPGIERYLEQGIRKIDPDTEWFCIPPRTEERKVIEDLVYAEKEKVKAVVIQRRTDSFYVDGGKDKTRELELYYQEGKDEIEKRQLDYVQFDDYLEVVRPSGLEIEIFPFEFGPSFLVTWYEKDGDKLLYNFPYGPAGIVKRDIVYAK